MVHLWIIDFLLTEPNGRKKKETLPCDYVAIDRVEKLLNDNAGH